MQHFRYLIFSGVGALYFPRNHNDTLWRTRAVFIII